MKEKDVSESGRKMSRHPERLLKAAQFEKQQSLVETP